MRNQFPHNQIPGNRILTSQNSQGWEDRMALSKMYNSIQSNQYGISIGSDIIFQKVKYNECSSVGGSDLV